MAARSFLRAASLCRRNLVVSSSFARKQSIFTKYREPPNGFLFNEKPLKPGEKRQWEDWEEPWYRWWSLILVVMPVLFYYRPETDPVVWAKKEAEKIVAARDAAEAEAAARGEPVDEGGDIGNFKLSKFEPLM
ncbi:hypothetical protein OS493_028323 [Desmophyllum pertusum]|uniref:NADH dehydrogenase [ubiquinone] 1 beta subcomplex subunit 11, mitochondrial n=1 Tax=Desmophyllum pertusum TaxID=174260 RepID=A0A9W9Y9C0_9CNID|nr:hypothetical protein OS493_028323 [Desmophyllum pertusum]